MQRTAHFGTWLLLALFVGACDGATPTCEGCDPLHLTLGTVDDLGEHVPHEPGTPFPWSWGFQGGAMIVPAFALDGEVREGETLWLTLRHEADPAHPEALGQIANFPRLERIETVWRAPSGTLVIGPVLDPIGWSSLDGARFRLIAEVRTSEGRIGTLTEDLALVSSMPEDPSCASFPEETAGCVYRVFPGVVTVTAITEPAAGAYSCAEGRAVELAFAVDEPELAASCLASLGGALPTEPQYVFHPTGAHASAACLETAGVTVGATFPARFRQIIRGACAPDPFRIDIDLSACPCD